jgi:hypothetical protein
MSKPQTGSTLRCSISSIGPAAMEETESRLFLA